MVGSLTVTSMWCALFGLLDLTFDVVIRPFFYSCFLPQ